jgi:hypothetical protein
LNAIFGLFPLDLEPSDSPRLNFNTILCFNVAIQLSELYWNLLGLIQAVVIRFFCIKLLKSLYFREFFDQNFKFGIQNLHNLMTNFQHFYFHPISPQLFIFSFAHFCIHLPQFIFLQLSSFLPITTSLILSHFVVDIHIESQVQIFCSHRLEILSTLANCYQRPNVCPHRDLGVRPMLCTHPHCQTDPLCFSQFISIIYPVRIPSSANALQLISH